ncbi:hypothetical protein N5T43_13700 [Escherichia coli]|nr:hypothetical protein [Escherichia coli]MCW3325600.1 hypothetical protein [Escherichia coli]
MRNTVRKAGIISRRRRLLFQFAD